MPLLLLRASEPAAEPTAQEEAGPSPASALAAATKDPRRLQVGASKSSTASVFSSSTQPPMGLKKCRALARQHAATPFLPNHWEPNSIAFQKMMAKEEAIAAWQAQWHNAPRPTDPYTAFPHPLSDTIPLVIETHASPWQH